MPGRFPLFTDDAFDDLAAQNDVFAYPIAYLKLPR